MDKRQIYAIKSQWAKKLKELCPEINNQSGIYFWWRKEFTDEIPIKMYIGKATNLMDRSISHCMGYSQHIDNSIRKRKFYNEKDNPQGWHLKIINYEQTMLDKMEQYYIDYYKDKVELLNIESGGTIGKTLINERKSPKNYRDGIKQGYENARKEIIKLFDKNLVACINGKTNKNKEKALEKFKNFINNRD